MGRWFQFALGVAIAGLFVWLILRHVDVADVWGALAASQPGWIAAAVVLFFAGYAARVARWRLMLSDGNPQITGGRAFGPFMASIAANNVLPFRAGDVLRAFGFTKWLGQSASAVLATLLVERFLDLLTLLLALGLALFWFGLGGETAGQLVGMGATGLIALGLCVLAVLLFPGLLAPIVFAVIRLVARVSAGLGRKLEAAATKVFETLATQAKGPRMVVLVLWSFVAWICEGLVFYCTALALPMLVEATAVWLALPVGTLSTLIPSTPGYLGTFDFFVVQAMQLVGNPAVAATAFAVLVHMVLWLPVTIVGGICLLYLNSQGAFTRPSASTDTSEPAKAI
ncbi:hypothetical protein AIOL_004711 [Candidatus Rhodobacter oscarellae]|uniref:Uncharacterized protein n=1 Tax=Candidatus Rhodobacter oscarellae TaxID=1675527 RepID=A0A0J9H1Y4_9RHOB|nr:lysylphosphatidylglycerol synthase transmembrane domain-containing protein [Candidatus Rhodobacter lobularis]KMW59728.1 hypothetical protein AIOL_004711 [Candidatus Rhodobacter lobularis]